MNPDDDDQGRGRAQGERRPMDVEAVVGRTRPRRTRSNWNARESGVAARRNPRAADPTVAAAPDAQAVAAALTCVKRALAALPTDHCTRSSRAVTHRARAVTRPGLDGDPNK